MSTFLYTKLTVKLWLDVPTNMHTLYSRVTKCNSIGLKADKDGFPPDLIHISCSYDDILEMTNLPTPHDRRTMLCRAYFNKMNRTNHKLNALLPGRRTVPYALRASNGLPVPSVKPNRYKNSFILVWTTGCTPSLCALFVCVCPSQVMTP